MLYQYSIEVVGFVLKANSFLGSNHNKVVVFHQYFVYQCCFWDFKKYKEIVHATLLRYSQTDQSNS